VPDGGGPDPAQAVGEIAVHVEVPADVGAGQAELSRPPQDPAQRLRGSGDQDRGVRGSGLAAVPGAQPDRQVEAGLDPQQVRDDVGDVGLGRHVADGHVVGLDAGRIHVRSLFISGPG